MGKKSEESTQPVKVFIPQRVASKCIVLYLLYTRLIPGCVCTQESLIDKGWN